jgi:hypothetical protein
VIRKQQGKMGQRKFHEILGARKFGTFDRYRAIIRPWEHERGTDGLSAIPRDDGQFDVLKGRKFWPHAQISGCQLHTCRSEKNMEQRAPFEVIRFFAAANRCSQKNNPPNARIVTPRKMLMENQTSHAMTHEVDATMGKSSDEPAEIIRMRLNGSLRGGIFKGDGIISCHPTLSGEHIH